MPKDAVAQLCIVGKHNINWIYLVIDQVEWTDPRYGHQN